MTRRSRVFVRVATVAAAAMLWGGSQASAQVTPAAGYTPPDDTPSVRVGGVLFLDYTNTQEPQVTDADGNSVSQSAFNVGRAYINVTGQSMSPPVPRHAGHRSRDRHRQFPQRVADVSAEYGYAQFNMDDWLWRGTYVRFGMIQTPYVDFEETVYRYRFQGTVFVDREGYNSSSDFGLSFRTAFPNNYGEVIAGYYNGDSYTRVDPNDQKSFRIRATVRPFPGRGCSAACA